MENFAYRLRERERDGRSMFLQLTFICGHVAHEIVTNPALNSEGQNGLCTTLSPLEACQYRAQ
jgi:hypothetical protein